MRLPWRREPKTHETVGLHPGDLALRIALVVAVLGVFAWVWTQI